MIEYDRSSDLLCLCSFPRFSFNRRARFGSIINKSNHLSQGKANCNQSKTNNNNWYSGM